MRLTVVDVDTTLVTKRRDVDYETINKNTAKLDQGENKIDRQGKTGVRTVVYREVRRDGKLASRKKISSKITKDPVDKVVLIGTKKPAPVENGGGGSSGGSSGGGSTPGDSVLGPAGPVRDRATLEHRQCAGLLRWTGLRAQQLDRVRRQW